MEASIQGLPKLPTLTWSLLADDVANVSQFDAAKFSLKFFLIGPPPLGHTGSSGPPLEELYNQSPG